jgi:sulfur carrier protein
MNVELNGESIELGEGASVADAVAAAGADSGRRGVAVAVDGEVVPRSGWEATSLQDGQRVEVVEAIQGGESFPRRAPLPLARDSNHRS